MSLTFPFATLPPVIICHLSPAKDKTLHYNFTRFFLAIPLYSGIAIVLQRHLFSSRVFFVFFSSHAHMSRYQLFSGKWLNGGFSTTANRMVIFLKLKNFFLIVKIDLFLAKTPFLGRKMKFSILFQESGQMGAFDDCESNGDIPKAQKLLLDSKNSSFLAKTPFLGRKIKFSTFFRKVAKWGF